MTQFNSSYNDTIPFSDNTYQFGLNSGAALTITIPGDSAHQFRANFSWPYNANVWVGFNVTATTPSLGSVTTNNGIELRPDFRFVRGGDVLSFISDATVTDAGVSLLRTPG